MMYLAKQTVVLLELAFYLLVVLLLISEEFHRCIPHIESKQLSDLVLLD